MCCFAVVEAHLNSCFIKHSIGIYSLLAVCSFSKLVMSLYSSLGMRILLLMYTICAVVMRFVLRVWMSDEIS
jgi:hypothetical protein